MNFTICLWPVYGTGVPAYELDENGDMDKEKPVMLKDKDDKPTDKQATMYKMCGFNLFSLIGFKQVATKATEGYDQTTVLLAGNQSFDTVFSMERCLTEIGQLAENSQKSILVPAGVPAAKPHMLQPNPPRGRR